MNKTTEDNSNLELTTGGAHLRAHSKGYQDGYQKGLQDGKDKQLEQLRLQVKLLSWRILELEKKLDKEQSGINI